MAQMQKFTLGCNLEEEGMNEWIKEERERRGMNEGKSQRKREQKRESKTKGI